MRQLKSGLLILACLLVLAGHVKAQDKPFAEGGEATNAALIYWQAFAMLPELDQTEIEVLKGIESGESLLAEGEKILARSADSLQLASEINASTECHWEIVQKGPHTLLPHLSKARMLARLMLLDARIKVSAGQHEQAIERLANSWLVARNLDEGVLLHLLVANAIETLTIDVAEQIVAEGNDATIANLAEKVEALPKRSTLATSMRHEREVFVGWLEPIMKGDVESARQELRGLFWNDDPAAMDAMLGGGDEARAKRFAEFDALFDEVIDAVGSKDADAQIAELEQAIGESKNALVGMLMPAFAKVYEQDAKLVARFEGLKSALAKGG